MSELNEAIRQFDATEANLKRLEEVWEEMKALIPAGMVIDLSSPDAQRYGSLRRTFNHILKSMPTIDSFQLRDQLIGLDEVFQLRLDAHEIGDAESMISVEQRIYSQEDELEEYRFRFSAQRRTLVRSALNSAVVKVDAVIAQLTRRDPENSPREVSGAEWDELNRLIKEIGVLCGSSIRPVAHWSNLQRHLHFGLTCDLHDIINHDWPAVKRALQAAMYGRDDPIPVDVEDLGDLVKNAPTGSVITALRWQNLDADAFERLIYNLVSDAPGYQNPQWLTHTNAPDRGRDISATKTIEDTLSGSRASRVVIQCKHWLNRAIGVEELSKLVNQMQLWEPPKVDELVIATTGRFSSDAVAWVEKRNHERLVPLIMMWPESHLELLLAARPHLVVQFGLR